MATGKANLPTKGNLPYAILEPQIQRVAASKIRKKWKKLPQGAHGKLKHAFLTLHAQSLAAASGKLSGDAESLVELNEIGERSITDLMSKLPRS